MLFGDGVWGCKRGEGWGEGEVAGEGLSCRSSGTERLEFVIIPLVFLAFCACVFVLFFFFKLLKHHTQHNTKGSPSQKKTTVEVGLTTPVLSLNLRKENDRGFLVLLYCGLYGSGVGACLGRRISQVGGARGEVFRKLN